MTFGVEALRASTLPRVLLVSHGGEGGIARHLSDLAELLEGRAEVLSLAPDAAATIALAYRDRSLWFGNTEWDALLAVLRGVGIDRVHYHHVHGLPMRVLDLGRDLGASWDVTLHDYFPACPAYHLTGADARYCGGTPACLRCEETRKDQWQLGIAQWRERLGALLAGAGRVIVPSRDTAQRVCEFFPRIEPLVWPHPEHRPTPAQSEIRVLVPGAISPEKGLGTLDACVRDAAARKLPLHFRVVGFIARPIPLWPDLPISLTGEYPEGALPALLARERGDAVLFPVQVPETYSYTLSAALDTSLPIVASKLGAFIERLAGRGDCRLVPWDAPGAAFNEALMAVAHPPSPAAPRDRGNSPDEYRSRYVATLPRSTAPSRATLPALQPRWLEAPDRRPPATTLQWLVEDAFDCGRMRTLRRLKSTVLEADARLTRSGRS